ncbi:MAG TPA: GGDEF domain-containing phosphodiesterase, partial [Solirubrobacteraceae bacterium]|nr:GGDEF domain-containing phosphodiesterase [Solirubrobacteraceae bacterium]
QGVLGEQAVLARFSGDEYAILCPRASGVAGALESAAEIHKSLESPMQLNGVALNVEVSIGVSVVEHRDEDLDQLLQRAGAALAHAKVHRSRIEVYSAERDSFDATRLLLLGQVRTALKRREFELHYQPKIDLRSGRVVGVEALVRWRHPERGLMMPMTFIPLLEQTALVGPVTLQVIDTALAQAARWRDRGLELGMAVNLSARNLLDRDLPGQVAALLHRHELTPSCLTLEITESATMSDPLRAAEVLHALRSTGAGISIDDFGTGNASLSYLASLPASEIKIDRSFVAGVCEDKRSEAIIRAIVDLAGNLHMRVVAEGIETRVVIERLIELGCDVGQGYLISRPVAAAELTAWLARPSAGAVACRDGAREATTALAHRQR